MVRTSLGRKLDALGYRLGKPFRASGLRVHPATSNSEAWLLIEGSPIGICWPQIHFDLCEAGFEAKILSLGNQFFVVARDSVSLRQVLAKLAQTANSDRQRLVHIPGVGFEPTSEGKKFKPRAFLGPIVSLGASLLLMTGIGALSNSADSPESAPKESQEVISCALDLDSFEYSGWLRDQLKDHRDELTNSQVLIGSSLGSISASLVDQVGSAALLRIEIACADGRQQSQLFRSDLSLRGPLVKLPSD